MIFRSSHLSTLRTFAPGTCNDFQKYPTTYYIVVPALTIRRFQDWVTPMGPFVGCPPIMNSAVRSGLELRPKIAPVSIFIM
jgi:hypothetical protein